MNHESTQPAHVKTLGLLNAALVQNTDLRAEIERWRDGNIRMRAEMENQAARANRAEWDLAAANEHLDKLREQVRVLDTACHDRDDEIERLKVERSGFIAQLFAHMEGMNKLRVQLGLPPVNHVSIMPGEEKK